MGIRINADGTRGPIAPAIGAAFSLIELQGVVGGFIEGVRLRGGFWMFVNEDGKRLALPYNDLATQLARTDGFLPLDDYIVGDVVVCTTAEAGGTDEGAE